MENKQDLNKNFPLDTLAQAGIQRASVTWYDNAVELGHRRVLALGFCGYGKGVAFIAVYSPNEPITGEWLKLVAVKDVLVKGEGCRDARWCLNLKCPFNKAEPRRFAKYGVKNLEMLKNLHDFLEDCSEKLRLESKGSVVIAYQKPPLKLKRVGK